MVNSEYSWFERTVNEKHRISLPFSRKILEEIEQGNPLSLYLLRDEFKLPFVCCTTATQDLQVTPNLIINLENILAADMPKINSNGRIVLSKFICDELDIQKRDKIYVVTTINHIRIYTAYNKDQYFANLSFENLKVN